MNKHHLPHQSSRDQPDPEGTLHHQTQETLRQSEEKYRKLFETMDTGFTVGEAMRDERGKMVNYRLLQLNPAFEKLTGLKANESLGQPILEVLPGLDSWWLQTYQQVVDSRETVRVEAFVPQLNRWYEVTAFYYAEEQFATYYNDITKRKRQEANLVLLAQVTADFAPLMSTEAIMQHVADRLAEHLQLSRCLLAVVDPEADRIEVIYDWKRDTTMPPLLGVHRISDNLTDIGRRHYSAGELFVMNATKENPMMNAPADVLKAIGFGSLVDVPYRQNGHWRFLLTIGRSQAGEWRDDELELIQELAERIYLRIERARAEEALSQSEKKYRTLFNIIDQGFALCELVRNPEGKGVDYRALELNPAYDKQMGMRRETLLGRTALDVFPTIDPWWIDTCTAVVNTGQPAQFEQYFEHLQRWYDIGAYRVQDEQFAVLYSDITNRKRHEANLAFLAEVSRDLVHLKTIDETMNALGTKIGHHFTATHCTFFEFNEAMDKAVCQYDWHQVNQPSLVGNYRTSDFYTDEFLQIMRAGDAFVVTDREADSRADAKNLAALNIASCIVIPIVTGRELLFVLSINDSQTRDWRDDEIELMRETTNRIWTRLERARAEEALRQSEARFRALATIGSSSVYFMSPDWGEMRQLDGAGFLVNTHEPTTNWIDTYIPPDEQPRVRQAIDRAIRTKDVFELEHRVLSVDGTVGWTFSRAIPLLNEAGKITEWFGAATDVTARVKADQRFTRLFQASPAPFLVVQPDAPRFPITEVNDAYLAATMRTREEVVGRGIFEAYPDNPDEATNGGVSVLRTSLERVLASHQPDRLPGLKYDIARPDGTFEQRWWSPVNSPVLDENGQVEAIIHNANDVTQERRSQQVLRASEARQTFLLKLSDALRPLSDSAQLERTAMRVLGQELGVARAFFATIDADGESWSIQHDYTDGVASQVGRYPMSQFQKSRLPQWQAGRMSSITDSETDAGLSAADRAAYAVLGTRAAIGVPLVKGGRFAALLSVNQTEARVWTEAELALTREAAERTWVAIEGAKAEEALHESQKRFESIANLVPDLLWDSQPDGSTNWYNQRWLEYTGQPFEEAIGWGWTDAIYPDDRDASDRRYQEAVAAGTSLQQEHRIRRHDGVYRWFVVSAAPLKDARGQVVRMYGAATDIHERKLAETALQKSEERWRLAIEATELATWEWHLDTNQVYWNEQHFRLFGMEPQVGPLSPDAFMRHVHPHEQARIKELLERAIAERGIYDTEFCAVLEDGSTRWMSGYGRITEERDGQPVRMSGVMLDVDERRRAQEALLASEQKFRTLSDAAPALIWQHDDQGRNQFVNQRFIEFVGLTPQQLEGVGWQSIIHPDDQQAYIADYLSAVGERRGFSHTSRLRRADGQWRWFANYAQPLVSLGGQFLGHVGASVDMTDRHQQAEALRVADRRKDEFLAMLAHELRNPLAPIRNGLQLLGQTPTTDPTLSVLLPIMNRNMTHVVRMVDDLLDVSRISRGKIELTSHRIELVALVSQALESMRPQYASASRQLRAVLPAAPLYLLGDATRLNQVVTNLLTNGLRYTGEDGQVLLSLEAIDGQALLQVSDNGIGLSVDQLEAIFELFVQVDNSLARSHGGLGLGLTLVQQLVEQHGGRVQAQSPGLGQGSTFSIYLPLD